MKKMLAALVAIAMVGCVADDAEPPTIDGIWTISADVSPCRDSLTVLEFEIVGTEANVVGDFGWDPTVSHSWDPFKNVLSVETTGASWVIEILLDTEDARVWFDDGACSVEAVPAASVEHM